MVGTVACPPAVANGSSEVSAGSKGTFQAAAKYTALSRLKVFSRLYFAGAFLIRPPVFWFTQASIAGLVTSSSWNSTGYTPAP